MNELEQFFYNQNHKRGRPTNKQRNNIATVASMIKEGDTVFYDEIEGARRKKCAGCITKLEGSYAWINGSKYRIDRHSIFPAPH